MAEAFVPLSNLDFNQAIAPSPLLVSGETSLLDALMLMSRERAACALPADPAMQSDPVYPLLMENRASCVLVVQDEQLIGILTERDIVRLCASRRFSIETASSSGQTLLSEIQVAEVMTHPVMSVRRSQLTDVFVPLSLFRQHHIRHLPVLDEDGKILGLLTQNALRYLLRPIDLLRLRLVTEVMMTRVVCAYPTDSILHLTQLMANHRISSIVIVEEYPPPRIHPQIEAPNPLPENLPETLLDDSSEMPPLSFPVGIITERDIVQFQALGLDFEQIQAQTVMSTPVFAVSPNLSLWDAHLQMQQRRVSRTVVIGSQGELRGIITQTCVLSVLNPLEIYNLMEALEHRVSQLEAEKLEILQQRNAELERQVQERTSALQRQAERERLLRAIANHIRATLNLQETLNAIVLEVRQFLHCDRVFLYQFLPDWSGVIVADACRREERSLIGEKVHDRCFQNWIGTYAGGQYRVIEDVQTVDLAPCHREMLERLEVRAKVLMPVICDGTLWGLFLASEKDYPRQWQREEIDLLRQLSTQISIAIQQSAAYERLQSELAERQRREQELQLLYTLTQLISTAPDFRAALEVTLREICHFANWLCGEVWLPNPEQTYLRPGSSYSGCDGLSPGADSFFSLSKTFTFEQNQGLPGRVWATQQPEWILNISQENAECFLRLDAAQEMGLRTACGIPILTNEKVVAVLVFFSIEEREQNAEFLNLIQSIANNWGKPYGANKRKLLYARAKQLTGRSSRQFPIC